MQGILDVDRPDGDGDEKLRGDELMPEPPDFKDLAMTATEIATEGLDYESRDVGDHLARLVTILQGVWNARGAADAHAVDEKLATLTGWVTSEPYRKQLREAIEALNRR